MTEQTTSKVAKLTPEEWKQLVLLNTAQLQNYLQSIPGNTETGVAGFTDQHMAIIDGHFARGRAFMRAWSLSTVEVAPAAQPPAPAHQANGAEPPKPHKGGWPKGKKRTPKQPQAGQ